MKAVPSVPAAIALLAALGPLVPAVALGAPSASGGAPQKSVAPPDATASPAKPAAGSPPPAVFDPKRLSIATNLGLLQPFVLGGANVEVDVRHRWFVFSYSHGWSLDLAGDQLTGAMHDQGVALHIPFTTGFGVGPSLWIEPLRMFVDLRFEAKMHRFEASYDSEDGEVRTHITTYDTFTLGGGLYATAMPFAKATNALRGLNASLSFRVWPNVATTLDEGEVSYENERTGRTEVHEAANIGIANTPIIVNLSVGYVFQ